MGVDVYGTVEIQRPLHATPDKWVGIVTLENLVERNYSMFGALFGVRNADGVTPVFADRGLPADISGEALFDLQGAAGGVKPSWVLWSELSTIEWDEITSTARIGGDSVYVWMTPGWRACFGVMRVLADNFGGDHVRLVVWFDSE